MRQFDVLDQVSHQLTRNTTEIQVTHKDASHVPPIPNRVAHPGSGLVVEQAGISARISTRP